MPTNPYFNFFGYTNEQELVQDLITETIRIYGHNFAYLPRERVRYDHLWGEDPIGRFNDAIGVEMYVKSVDGFTGDGDILSRVGLFIKDELTVTVARDVWAGLSGAPDRPQEGDLIYFPMVRKVFKVKFVEHEDIFYQTGALQSYDIVCELWDYASEVLNANPDDAFANSVIAIQANGVFANVASMSLDELLGADDQPESRDSLANNQLFIDTDVVDDSEESPFGR